jgi:hypothetical protein
MAMARTLHFSSASANGNNAAAASREHQQGVTDMFQFFYSLFSLADTIIWGN